MSYLEAITKVLIVGLILGAGLPAVFAAGMVAFSAGTGGEHPDGTVSAPNRALKYLGLALFTLVGAVVVIAILWITRTTIIHHFGIDPFPMLSK
ncbi:hypothetical protein A5724_26800 [Mycobacterium sp. ACS1612]|uniref:hypothetical protein n=1 Tax=Mycobacterium sp. ACS1612 TaxID=1834117 RepID=UPI0007FEB873|nr:hypothetical protein [Mycobacterium sp. ACS1612]OBF29001.1 hypothetical protein A5724_26800 [Mycobacterium sp. ACS1612]